MARVFFALAVLSLIALIGVTVQGFRIGDYNGAARELEAAQQAVQEAQDPFGRSKDLLAKRETERDQIAARNLPILRSAGWHRVLGTGVALITLLVNCLSVTYFIGTTRWCTEVAEAYSLDSQLAENSRQMKRQSFPWSLGGIGILMLIIISGAACDPLSGILGNPAGWVVIHWIVSVVGVGLLGFSFWVQVGYIGAHFEIIEKILQQVREIRAAKKLDEE